MMSAELVRAALGSSDPAGELDRLVRGQLAAGRTTAQLYEELVPVARTIRQETPLPEDADEVLLGTLDALIGHCNPDECYQDLPRAPQPAGANGRGESATARPAGTP